MKTYKNLVSIILVSSILSVYCDEGDFKIVYDNDAIIPEKPQLTSGVVPISDKDVIAPLTDGKPVLIEPVVIIEDIVEESVPEPIPEEEECLPDLVLDLPALQTNYRLSIRNLRPDLQCAIEEKCLDIDPENLDEEEQVRILFRFNVQTWNFGECDATPPEKDKSKWSYHACHKHKHGVNTFATFKILADSGVVASGMKASFCMEDSNCIKNVDKPYTCNGDQGIHVNCSDIYFVGLDCQWIDTTYLQTDVYDLQVCVNPCLAIKESDYTNNCARCPLDYKVTEEDTYTLIEAEMKECQYVSVPMDDNVCANGAN